MQPESKSHLWGSAQGKNTPLWLPGDITPQKHPVRLIKGRRCTSPSTADMCKRLLYFHQSLSFKHISPSFHPNILLLFYSFSLSHIYIILSLCVQRQSSRPSPVAFSLRLFPSVPSVPFSPPSIGSDAKPPRKQSCPPGNLGPFPPESKSAYLDSLFPRPPSSHFIAFFHRAALHLLSSNIDWICPEFVFVSVTLKIL